MVERGGLAAILNLRTGSRVLYGDDEVSGTVRYLGQGPNGGLGWVIGLEIKVGTYIRDVDPNPYHFVLPDSGSKK